jgi:hypothetical protein
LLIPYGSFAETKSDENYPDAIKCIVDKYVASFPKVEGPSIYKWPLKGRERPGLGYSFLGTSALNNELKNEPYKETYLGSLKVKSVEIFSLGRNASKKSYDLNLEIWTMEKSIDINKFPSVLDDIDNSVPWGGLPKQPWNFFVYENIFVLLWARATMFSELVDENACEIIKTCFDCSDIDDRFNSFVAYREKRCGCGKGKDDEKEGQK